MLVLSRRLKEKIVFPSIETEVQVLGMKGGQVRLGIEAPPQVSVLRKELSDRAEARNGGDTGWSPASESMREFRHRIRNRLNDLGLNVALLRHQFDRPDVAESTMCKIEEELQLLHQELEREFEETGAGYEEADVTANAQQG